MVGDEWPPAAQKGTVATQKGPANRGPLKACNRRVERGDLLGNSRLLVGCLVHVDDTLASGLVELLRRDDEGCLSLVLVTSCDGEARCADCRTHFALDGLVASGRLGVGADALDLRLDICHVFNVLSLGNG